MMDGRSTVNLMKGLLDVVPRAVPEEAPDWIPRPAPGPEALLRDGLVDRARIALQAAQASARWLGSGAWRDLGAPVAATGPSASQTDTVGPSPRYYRVITQ